MPDFVGPDLSTPNSPDLNLMDYNVGGVECPMNSVDELKLRLIDVWNSLQQNAIDAAINDWRKQQRACMHACRLHADGQHFEQLLRAHVTNKSCGQIKLKQLKKMLLYGGTCDFRGLKVSQGKVHTIHR